MALGVCKARRDDLTAASFGASDAKMELVGHRQQDLLCTSHTSDGWGGWGEWSARRQKLAVRRRAGTRNCKEIDSRLTWTQEPELKGLAGANWATRCLERLKRMT